MKTMKTIKTTDIDKLTQEMLELIESGQLRRRDPYTGTYRDSEIKQVLAGEFGRRYGWKLSRSCFGLKTLSGRLRHCVHDYASGDALAIDHPYFYRDPVRPYRAAALAVHLYNWPDVQPEVEAICERSALTFEHITHFPSWWYPGHTELILYRPATVLASTNLTRHRYV